MVWNPSRTPETLVPKIRALLERVQRIELLSKLVRFHRLLEMQLRVKKIQGGRDVA